MQEVRCAIYTRKSTDEGLEKEFNTLEAQRESGENYIRSQKHQGWVLVDKHYDDGGYSGGNMKRPALQELFADIQAGQIDMIVVYKIDRLTRSLIDFSKMVDLFDKHNCSFVSVTQNFNTSDSMGRLTLNMLLSFARFEREIGSERVRDKQAASKKKGMWTGGVIPFGYQTVNKKLEIKPDEAEAVRFMFEMYVKYKSAMAVCKLLTESGYKSFRRDAVKRMLKNPLYMGKVRYKNELYNGQHPAIISPEMFAEVQTIRETKLPSERTCLFQKNEVGLLRGLLICGCCHTPMTPASSQTRGVRRFYYTSTKAKYYGYHQCANGAVPVALMDECVLKLIIPLLKDIKILNGLINKISLYEVRATRLDEKDTSSRAGHEIRWTSAKGFINAEHEYGNVTMIALKMQATNNLSQRSSRLLNCVVTRKLPQWTPEKGWSEPVPTNSIAWALADVLKAEYGAKLDDSRIDLETLLYLDGIWQNRGDTFNAVFDSKLTVFEALSRIAKCGRAVAFLQGGIVRFVRDESKTIPVALFSPRNIIKNSLSIQYIMPSEDTADSVTVEYFSDKTWKTTEITGVLPESTSENTATVELFGCTNKEQALREALYMAAANRYRRRIVNFMTELDGLIPTYGDLVAITHDMPSWGQGGEVIQKDGNKLTLSEPVIFSDDSVHYIALRKVNGQLSGPYIVTSGNLENEVVLEETPDFEIYTGTSRERTHFAFGPADKWATMARIIGIKPRTNTVEITAVIEDERVHLN